MALDSVTEAQLFSYVANQLRGNDSFRSDVPEGTVWEGFGGDDVFNLGTGNDSIYGGSGFDTLIVADTWDNIDGDFLGDEVIELYSAFGTDYLDSIELLVLEDETISLTYLDGNGRGDRQADASISAIVGSDSAQRMRGDNGDDAIFGLGGHDVLIGGGGRDSMIGNGGNDVLRGGNRSDLLVGDLGNDKLFGGRGIDVLDGGAGKDVLVGGAGKDVFVFDDVSNWNRIKDFGNGTDRLFIEGATSLSDLDFRQKGDKTIIRFEDTTIRVDGWDVEDLQNEDFFLF